MADNGQKIIELDQKRMQATVKQDFATLESIIADDLIYTHSTARIDTKESLIGNMKSGVSPGSASKGNVSVAMAATS